MVQLLLLGADPALDETKPLPPSSSWWRRLAFDFLVLALSVLLNSCVTLDKLPSFSGPFGSLKGG